MHDVSAGRWRPFRTHFESNARRPLPPVATAVPQGAVWEGADTFALRAFAAVVARFQLGEAGGGRIAHEIDRVHITGVDDDYRAALKLFVKEEGRHARILAGIVRHLGGALLHAKASNHLFRRARRLLGVRFKVLVLLVAEVVGGVMYDVLAGRSVIDRQTAAALAQIGDDERAHLRFHAAFLATQGPLWRRILRAAFWLVGGCAAGVVLIENFADLVRLGLSPARIADRLVRGLCHADRCAFVRAGGSSTFAVGGLS